MFEMTYGEMFLFLWAVTASAGVWQYRKTANERGRILMGAAMFVMRVVQDDSLREELRVELSKGKEVEFKFGVGE